MSAKPKREIMKEKRRRMKAQGLVPLPQLWCTPELAKSIREQVCREQEFLATCTSVNYEQAEGRRKRLKDGEPCSHPGCLHHVTHPCEGCGRIAGKY